MTTARILKLYKRFKTGGKKEDTEITPAEIKEAEKIWIIDAKKELISENGKGKLKKLSPELQEGILVVGGRAERWMEATYNNQKFILLPQSHKLSYLIALHEHKAIGHLGTEATIARIRSKYWIVGVRKIVKGIIYKCVPCKKKNKRCAEQKMSPLPIERLKPSPAFQNIGIDYFGPMLTKGEVQKRVRGKGYGIIITCDVSRAVYLDFVPDYSTNALLQAIRRFASMRGWPSKIHSDPGSQLKAAAKEIQQMIQSIDWMSIKEYGLQFGTTWYFQPADAPWYNGSTEALVKTAKRALLVTIGEQAFTFSEYLTIMFETAELINERPIGIKSLSPDEGTYLCPNDLLLGRSTSHVPQGHFNEKATNTSRYLFLQTIVNNFWKRWTREVFPNLVIQPKWHVQRRNVRIGDVVLLQDSNVLRGEWKMGTITDIYTSRDNHVRKAEVTYKRESTSITVSRPIQKLIILVPNESSSDDTEVVMKIKGKIFYNTQKAVDIQMALPGQEESPGISTSQKQISEEDVGDVSFPQKIACIQSIRNEDVINVSYSQKITDVQSIHDEAVEDYRSRRR